jgi:D-aminopeptidase
VNVRAGIILLACTAGLIVATSAFATEQPRPRLRDLGVMIGVYEPGAHNAITDVAGVRVGHRTLVEGERIRTGVTAIVPHEGNVFQEKTPAAVVVGNGFGKLMGSTQVQELGELETPILLTNTLAVPQVAEGVIRWTLAQRGNEGVGSVNALVGETNDGRLNDIRARTVTFQHAIDAIGAARGGAVDEGDVGAGAGTVAFGLKGGVGTSSRRLPQPQGGYTIGVLVQSNFGGLLTIAGASIWKDLNMNPFAPEPSSQTGGSIMIVVATDAPLSDRNLERLAKRALVGLSRTGATISNGSGDYVIAFSNAQEARRTPERRARVAAVSDLPNDSMTPLFQAVAEATEEAIVNSMLRAHGVRNAVGRADALDPEAIRRAARR